MRRIIAVVAVVSIAAAWGTPAASEDGILVYFAPRGGCTAAIVQHIENTEDSVFMLHSRASAGRFYGTSCGERGVDGTIQSGDSR